LEFCTVAELRPAVAVKELADNWSIGDQPRSSSPTGFGSTPLRSLRGCRRFTISGIAPEIDITISTKKGTIVITDNGLGVAAYTITWLLDYRNKTAPALAQIRLTS
jgi:hypothetical protein